MLANKDSVDASGNPASCTIKPRWLKPGEIAFVGGVRGVVECVSTD